MAGSVSGTAGYAVEAVNLWTKFPPEHRDELALLLPGSVSFRAALQELAWPYPAGLPGVAPRV
jgi:hypothetical protein